MKRLREMSSKRRRTSIRADILDLDQLLKRLGAAQVEVAHMDNPHTFSIMMHPFTAHILDRHPEYEKVLAGIAAVEKVRRLSGMDADQKLIDLGIIAAAREVKEREAKRRESGEDPGAEAEA